MTKKYTLGQRCMAYLLLVSMFLQSCNHLSNAPIPMELETPAQNIDSQAFPQEEVEEAVLSQTEQVANTQEDPGDADKPGDKELLKKKRRYTPANLGTFFPFPDEVVERILHHLEPKEIGLVRMLSSGFYKLTTGFDEPGKMGVENKPTSNGLRLPINIIKLDLSLNFEDRIINSALIPTDDEANDEDRTPPFTEYLPKFSEDGMEILEDDMEIDVELTKRPNFTHETIPSLLFFRLLGEVTGLPQEFWPHLQGTRIHTLNFYNWGACYQGLDAVTLVKHLENTRVETLDLTGNALNEEQTIKLAKHLPKTPLKILNLRGNNIGAGAIKLLKALPLTQIQELDLSLNALGKINWTESLADDLLGAPIRKLNLSENKLGRTEWIESKLAREKFLAPKIESSHSELGVGEGSKMRTNFKVLIKKLARTQLQELDLSDNKIGGGVFVGDDDIIALAKYLPKTQIKKLNLRGSKLGTYNQNYIAECSNAEVLARILARTQIQELDLSYSELDSVRDKEDATDEIPPIIALAKYLSGTQIKRLSLCGNLIKDALAVKFASYLPNTQLQELDLSGNEISADTQGALMEQYPQIKWIF